MYHVGKVGHSQAVALDALVSQHVVHHHQLAVLHPGELTLELLHRVAVAAT